MREDTDKTNKVLTALSVLTPREQEIFNMLLGGAILKEIAHSLNISYNTVKTHQKKLYSKLNVRTVRELVTKYTRSAAEGMIIPGLNTVNSPPPPPPPLEPKITKPAVFTRWIVNKDNLGSSVSILEKIEHIEDQYFPTITIAGKLSSDNDTYAGTCALPDPSTLETMRKMKRLSFKVLGDGNSYAVTLPTTDTRLKGSMNHYRKLVSTKNGEISTITVDMGELVQVPYWGNPVPFTQSNIEFFQIHAHATSKFTLKIWDIKFFEF